MDRVSSYHFQKRAVSVLAMVALIIYSVLTGFFLNVTDFIELSSGFPSFILAVSIWSLVLWGLMLPFSFFSGFMLEHRFELSRQTPYAWVCVEMKNFVVAFLLGGGILSIGYFIMIRSPAYWWLWAALFFFLITIVLVRLAPVILFPLFYDFSPLKDGALTAMLRDLSRSQGFRIENVYSFDLGKETSKGNAALTGWGRTRRIIISDTLLNNMNPAEITAVFAHELGHARLKHIPKLIAWNGLGIILSFWVAFCISRICLSHFPFRFSSITDPNLFPVLLVSVLLVFLLLRPANLAYSRKLEKEADLFAVQQIGDASSLLSSLRKLGMQNLAEENPSEWVERFFYSHPPLGKRLRYLQKGEGTDS